jgi:flagellar biosynthesis/type III secretory pathway protein FliH
LYDLGYSGEQVRLAFGFVDWLLRLPDALREQFVAELRTFEEERQMSYITSIEELGIEKGIEQGIEQGRTEGRVAGLLEGIAFGLDLKFGDAAAPVIAEVQQLNDLALLEAIMRQIKTATILDEVRRVYAPTDNAEQ